MTDLLQRIRWANVARAAAVLLALALIFAWPHLRSSAPALPPAAATPLDASTEPRTTAIAAAPAKKKRVAKPRASTVKAKPAARKTRHRKNAPKPRRRAVVAAAPAPAPAPASPSPARVAVAVAAAPPPEPPGAEFRH
jgi:hypothetical protein